MIESIAVCHLTLLCLALTTDLFCMLVRTMYVVREDVGNLEVMVMCNVPSEDSFTLLVRSTDGTAMGKQMTD